MVRSEHGVFLPISCLEPARADDLKGTRPGGANAADVLDEPAGPAEEPARELLHPTARMLRRFVVRPALRGGPFVVSGVVDEG